MGNSTLEILRNPLIYILGFAVLIICLEAVARWLANPWEERANREGRYRVSIRVQDEIQKQTNLKMSDLRKLFGQEPALDIYEIGKMPKPLNILEMMDVGVDLCCAGIGIDLAVLPLLAQALEDGVHLPDPSGGLGVALLVILHTAFLMGAVLLSQITKASNMRSRAIIFPLIFGSFVLTTSFLLLGRIVN